MKFGLKEFELEYIIDAIKKFEEIEKVIEVYEQDHRFIEKLKKAAGE